MLVTEQGNSILVYGQGGKLLYKSIKIVQYAKLSSTSLVVITDETIDFVKEVEVDGRKDILVVNDVNFISAVIHDGLVYVQRKIVVPIMDIYNSELDNFVRLYQNVKGKWVYKLTFLGIPYKSIEPTHFKCPHHLYGNHKGNRVRVDLTNNKLSPSKYRIQPDYQFSSGLSMFLKS